MGFQALLKREDFYDVLQKTLQSFFQSKFGSSVYVGFEYREGAKEMVMNPKLGMIYSIKPNRLVRDYIYKYYNIRNNIIKKIAAKIFVFLSMHSNGLFTLPQKLYIYPGSLVGDAVVISYLNRSVRIFNFESNITYSIKKQTFTSKYFDNQVGFRLKYKFNFIPPITSYGTDWFEEDILDGKSLARESDDTLYNRGLSEALRDMTVIQKESFQLVESNVYLKSLISQITLLLENAKHIKNISTYSTVVKYLKTLTSSLKCKGILIPVAESHGDLQAGNIWLSKNKVWIIDWETHAIRSVWFDSITLKFGTRYYGGIANLLEKGDTLQTKKEVLGLFDSDIDMHSMIIIYLLEDLLFNLEDMMELPFLGGKDSFDGYITDIFSTDSLNKFIEK